MCARREKGAAVCREEHRRTDRELSGFPLSLSPHNSCTGVLSHSSIYAPNQHFKDPQPFTLCICICCSQTALLSFCFCVIILVLVNRNNLLTSRPFLPPAIYQLSLSLSLSLLFHPTIRYIPRPSPFVFGILDLSFFQNSIAS